MATIKPSKKSVLSAFSVYHKQSPGDKMEEDLSMIEVPGRKRRGSLEQTTSGKKKKFSSKKRLSLQKEDLSDLKNTKLGKWKTSSKMKVKKKNIATSKKDKHSSMSSSEDVSQNEEVIGDIEPDIPSQLGKPFKELFLLDQYKDSRSSARALFELLIQPYPSDTFFSETWEKKPILLRRHSPVYNDGWFSSKELDTILQENSLEYSVNLNITSYEDEKRITHNPLGRAYSSTVWEFYQTGCSIQFLNPQTFSKSMWLLTTTLQEMFGSFVGSNIYMTPAGTQGFAPHYDDIEAFIMQIEGKKQWKLYKPRSRQEMLPRVSSKNFSQSEIGESILDVVLEPGDLLYFPRGTIHQANALSDTHSLHITLSTSQKNTWADLLEKTVPVALQTAIEEDEDFRQSLPLDYMDYMGMVHSDETDPRRNAFMKKVCDLMYRIIQYAPTDAGADQMGVEYIHSALPPYLTEEEKEHGIWKQGTKLNDQGQVEYGTEMTLDTEIKLIRSRAMRLVLEGESGPMLYYCTNNSRVYREKDLEGMSIHPELSNGEALSLTLQQTTAIHVVKDAPGIEYLINSYPEYRLVKCIPIEGDDNKIELCHVLYNQGLITFK